MTYTAMLKRFQKVGSLTAILSCCGCERVGAEREDKQAG